MVCGCLRYIYIYRYRYRYKYRYIIYRTLVHKELKRTSNWGPGRAWLYLVKQGMAAFCSEICFFDMHYSRHHQHAKD